MIHPTTETMDTARWKDTGCSLVPRCLDCPLLACRYDLPAKRAGAVLREAALAALLTRGLTMDAAAAALGISRRTGFRLRRQAATRAVPVVMVSAPPRPVVWGVA